MFFTESAARLSARDTLEESQFEAQYNWDQFGQSSSVRESGTGRTVAIFDGAWRPLVRS